jgi:Ca-activated chloride channel family protein
MKVTYKFSLFTFFILFTAIFTTDSYAVGALFARPRNSTVEYQKMWIKKVETTVNIEEQIAVTHVDQTFYNEMSTSVETIFMFPLPANATVSELVYWVNGQRFVAEIREKAAAAAAYNEQVRKWLDPALLEYLGNNLFRLSIVPVAANSDVRTEITYVEPLSYDFGVVNYKFRLNTLGLSSKPLQKVLLNLEASSKFDYLQFSSPSHGNSTGALLTKIAGNHYKFLYGDENFIPDKDFTLEFKTCRTSIEFNALSYKPSSADSIGNDNFYTIWISPPDSVNDNDVIPKNIVFTADISSSMDGTRIQQLKEALNNFITLLTPADKFNIITFGTFVKSFKPDLVPADQGNIAAAKDFIQQLYALGLTNIDEAITASLKQSYGDSTSNNLVFFTDGYPTWGDTSRTNILLHAKQNNKNGTRIFSFGIGDEISKALLQDLADQNHGFCKIISSNDSIALVINDHFKRISSPVLTDISIGLGGLQSFDEYPKTINDLFWGNQLMQLGLYKNGGLFEVTLNGKIRSKPVQYKQLVYFNDATGSGHRFVPRLWAKQKIDYILNLIAAYGETKELVDQVIELSKRFQILTPYTSFYVDPKPSDVNGGNDDVSKYVPQKFALHQNYPNPFNPETRISYSLPFGLSNYRVVIKIYNTLGQLVKVLIDQEQSPGNHSVVWNGTDSNRRLVSNGIYIYTIQVGGIQANKKMALIK